MTSEEMVAAFERAFEAGRVAWPDAAVEPSLFARELRARAEPAGIEGLHASDLYLAVGCAAGDRGSLALFERDLGADVLRALARLRLTGPIAEEIHQRIRHKLFVACPDELPKIATYSGRGPLRSWLRALVAHEALSELRRGKRSRDESDSALGELAADDDPELVHVRARYAASFGQAARDAIVGLSPRDRNVLRMVYIEGLELEQVALLYGVHRVTVSRWLAQTRKQLLEGTRARLRERLALDESELASVTRLCLSQLDVSLDRLLSS